MVEPFRPTPGPAYLYVQVAEHVRQRIRAGELRSGARLPNEREFAAEYEVSVQTVRRAMDELEKSGHVEVVPSKGVFIS